MKRFLMLVGVAAVAAAMYVAASPASQQSRGPTLKQFNALKKQVATLNKKLKAVTTEADAAVCDHRGLLPAPEQRRHRWLQLHAGEPVRQQQLGLPVRHINGRHVTQERA